MVVQALTVYHSSCVLHGIKDNSRGKSMAYFALCNTVNMVRRGQWVGGDSGWEGSVGRRGQWVGGVSGWERSQ